MYNTLLERRRWHSSYSGLWWDSGELYFISQDRFLCRREAFNNQQLGPFGREKSCSSDWGVLSTQPQVYRPVKMTFLYLVHTCHVCNLLPKSSIQIAWRAAFVCHFTALKESRGQKFVNRAESKKGHHHHIKRETSLQTCGNALMIGRIRPGPFFTHWAHPRARG